MKIIIIIIIIDRVESVHLQMDGSNPNTIVSCAGDGLIKYWNIERCNNYNKSLILAINK